MITKTNINYRDLVLSWQINDKFHDIVNFEIVKNPYSRKLSKTSFFLKTRKWMLDWLEGLPEWWEITDAIELFNEDTDTYDTYIMRVDDFNRNQMRIFKVNWCTATQIWKPQCVKKWGYFKFIKTKFVKWKPRNVYADLIPEINWTDWIQVNKVSYTTKDYNVSTWAVTSQTTTWESELEFSEPITLWNDAWVRTVVNNPPDWQFGLPDLTWWWLVWHEFNFEPISWAINWIQTWDYLLVYWVVWGTQQWVYWVPTQVNVVTWKVDNLTLDVRSAWAWFYPKQYTWIGCKFRVYPERWDVFLIDTCEWLKLRTRDMDDALLDDDFVHTGFSYEPSRNLWENAWIITSINKTWYLKYWQYETLKFYSSLSQEVYIWTDVIATPTFQEYTLLFRKKSLSVIRFQFNTTTWRLEYQYAPTDLNIWLFSKDAYDLYRSSFYFIWSNKRLYALSIKASTTWIYETDLQDMSAIIKWELDNIWDTDKVYLQATEQNLKIFIVWDFRDNWRPIKTKVLIFDKDYQFRHKWELCNTVVTKEFNGKYLWERYFSHCWYSDEWNPYESRIEAFLWENEVASPANMFQSKNITWWFFALWQWSYLTDWNFYVQVDMYTNSLKPTFRIDNPESQYWIDYVKLLKRFRTWELTKPSEDMMQIISSCSNYENPCAWSWDSYDILVDSDECWCPQEVPKIDDYCVCIDDKKYFLSPFSVVNFNMKWDNNWSKLFKVSFVAKWGDILEFGWAVIPYWINPVEDKEMMYPNQWECQSCKDDDPCKCPPTWWEECWLDS